MIYIGSKEMENMRIGSKEIEVYVTDANRVAKKVFPENHNVTYIWDSKRTVVEKVKSGTNLLNPTEFTPTKSGCIFRGWTENSANTIPLTTKVMADKDVTLYAIWKYEDKVLVTNGLYELKAPRVTVYTTLLTIDSSKYEYHTVSGKVDSWNIMNPTAGLVVSELFINGTLTRFMERWAADDPRDRTGYPGSNGQTFTLTNQTGNLRFKYEVNGPIAMPWFRDVKVTGIGRSFTG